MKIIMSQADFNINDNNALSVVSTFQDVTCFDYCDGEITAVVSGGAPNFDINGNPIYLYSWNDILSQSSQTAVGLCVDNTTNTTEYNCIVRRTRMYRYRHSINMPQLIVSADYIEL